MLSEQSAPVIRATLPVVGAAVEDITELFYRKLFEAHPELLTDLFNRGNQANGEQRRALAGAVAGFAAALVANPGTAPEAMLSRIAHKHVSLGISADQYKIVHRHLFAAIAEVLGGAVTPEVAAAWDEVYWLMAESLIALEAGLYREAGVAEGEVWQSLEIAERIEQTADAVTLVLRRPDGTQAGPFRPGQYISVRIALPDGARQIRQYSLVAAPGRGDWRITVKRVPADAAGPAGEVSAHLHARARPGDRLTVSVPGGDLVLPEGDAPVLLASAGIGVTPVLAMLDHLAASGSSRPVTVLHADRTPADHAHEADQRRLVAALPGAALHLWYEQAPEGLPDGAALGRADLAGIDLPEGVTAYLCGPLPFMRALRDGLIERGVPAESVHYEVFGPDLWMAN
ncbi:hemin transporter [Actinospica durhamensis]|uniref:nitric oxide dioxygenase n=1 Tax=Actinospica durhamensis TaxID=1508375 RepID=A0A941EJK8_9ACTN|nr:globin domain-containing protein [Actinospica durhamensis]MBR7833690.1 hemin transporter [Actinospica durhamensis]